MDAGTVSPLAVANLSVAFLLVLWPLWFSTRVLHLPWLNPLTMAMAIDLPIQIMTLYGGPMFLLPDGLASRGFQYALLMGNLLLVSQLAGMLTFYFIADSLRIERYMPLRHLELTRSDIRRSMIFFVCLYLAAFVLLASGEFGVVNWILNPREGYQLYRVGHGQWFALAMSALAAAMLMMFLYKPTGRALLWRMPFIFALAFLLGTKGFLLQIFVSMVAFLWFIRWRHLNKALLLGTPFIFLLLLWNLYLAMADTDDFGTDSIFQYFEYYANAADYYEAVLNGDVRLFHGEVTVSSFWAYVPRALWPEKPFAYGAVLVNEIFFPGAAEETHTPGYGGAVEQFADFGIAGVIFFGFFSPKFIGTAILSYLTFKRPGVNFNRITMFTVFLLLVSYAPFFGGYLPGALYVVAVGAVILAIGLLRSRRTPRTQQGAVV